MSMNFLINAAIPSPLYFSQQLNTTNRKPIRAPLRCSTNNGEVNDLSTIPSQIELGAQDNTGVSKEEFRSSSIEREMKNNDIWRLFKEAQRNILYLNKQRLDAVEELNKTNREKQLLLEKIEQLEVEKQAGLGKGNLSIFWELLLRIDSMVLTGMINSGEASNLRKLVFDYKVSVADLFADILPEGDADLLAELRRFGSGSKKYACMNLDGVQGLREIKAECYSYFNGQLHANKIWIGVVSGIGVTFIQPLHYSSFFNRESVYGYSDDFERFTYFSRASLDYIVKSRKQPDVLHIHNWETAIVGPLFWDIFVKQGLEGTRILLSCHNLNSLCLEHPDKLALCGLDPARLHRPDRLQDNTKTHLVNILKGGVVYSNKVVIVSSMHSKGRIIRSLSHGLESTLAIHQDKLLVAPCGFDSSTWDPSNDKFLTENYCAEDMKGKTVCKVTLQQQLGLSKDASTIVVGCIFSDVSDVFLENLKAVVRGAKMRGIQFVFTGTNKLPSASRALVSFQEELKDGIVIFVDSYDDALLHLIFSGSDIILCHSFHDPLLQVPLKALKYGAAPIAVTSSDIEFRYFAEFDHESTRFSRFISSTFGNISLSQALEEIKNNPLSWKRKIKDAMLQDFSWDAECYDIHISAYTAIKNL
ncbi:probable starch synthase 4, chloroplastic/amyloplastic isoform X2 [Citrus clementina]|uniref:probable starch synthase 4, chloroplastic/amyloplastic isoform X2 n=1 Tax=Citrus clementina TaxID=85681 RepID=UPI000CED7243|nr:probable starch synthase 4, chloroplastic/amyloplastic isoform X2 [Citrus x clementina]